MYFFRLLPTSVIRFVGQIQFRYPASSRLINFLAQRLVSRGIGTIQRGEGRGLKFNGRGCNPGFILGTSEVREQQIVSETLSNGGVFYDVGANAGFYCIIAARKVGRDGKVYAFEPTTALATRIKENADVNGFENIEVIKSAVSATTGTIEFGIYDDLGVQNSIGAASSGGRIVRVPSVTLDDFTIDHPPPTLILIDIEGAELDALRGGLETIRQFLPTIMIEVHWLGEAFISFVEQYFSPLGYTATTYEGNSLPSDGSRYHCLLRPPATPLLDDRCTIAID